MPELTIAAPRYPDVKVRLSDCHHGSLPRIFVLTALCRVAARKSNKGTFKAFQVSDRILDEFTRAMEGCKRFSQAALVAGRYFHVV